MLNAMLLDLCGAGNIFCVVRLAEGRLVSHGYHLTKVREAKNKPLLPQCWFENEDITEWLAQRSFGVTPVCVEHHQRFLRCDRAAERAQTHPCYSLCVSEEQLQFVATLLDFRRLQRWRFSLRRGDLSKQTAVYGSCFLRQTFYKLQQLPVVSLWNFVIICVICFCKIPLWFRGHAERLLADCWLKEPFSRDADYWRCLSSYIQSYLWEMDPRNFISGIAVNVRRLSSWQEKTPPHWLTLMGCVRKVTFSIVFQSQRCRKTGPRPAAAANVPPGRDDLILSPVFRYLPVGESRRCFLTDVKVIRCVQHQALSSIFRIH